MTSEILTPDANAPT